MAIRTPKAPLHRGGFFRCADGLSGGQSLHGVGNLPYYHVIARSGATWQSPGTIHRNAPQKQTLYREIPTGPPALGMIS